MTTEGKRSKNTVWIVVGIILALLFCCIVAAGSGAVGFMVGRSSTSGGGMMSEGMPYSGTFPFQDEPGADSGQSTIIGGGIQVVGVIADSPAESAGLKVDDVIVAWDGEAITTDDDLIDAVQSSAAGTTVTLTIQRDDNEIEVEVTLGTNPDGQSDQAWLGIQYQEMEMMPMSLDAS